MQTHLNEVDSWCVTNHMRLNASKSKDMIFHFGENTSQLRPLRVRGDPIDSVDEATLLGLTISTRLGSLHKHLNPFLFTNLRSQQSKRDIMCYRHLPYIEKLQYHTGD